MSSDFRVLNFDGEAVKMVAMTFEYKGYTVSASNIMKGPVMAFGHHEEDDVSGDTVEEVITKISHIADKQAYLAYLETIEEHLT